MNPRIICAAAAVLLLSCGHRGEDAQRTLSSSARTLAVHVNGYVLDLQGPLPAVPPELDAMDAEPGSWLAVTPLGGNRLQRFDLPRSDPAVRPAPLGALDRVQAPLAVEAARAAKDAKAAGHAKPKKWIVQFGAPVGTTQRRQLEALGASVGDYLPDFAFLVTMDEAARRAAEELTGVVGVTRYKPAYKIAPALKDVSGAAGSRREDPSSRSRWSGPTTRAAAGRPRRS